jgi:hypothetical protein
LTLAAAGLLVALQALASGYVPDAQKMKPSEARRHFEKNCVFSVMPAKCFVCGPREEKARNCRAYSDRLEFSGVRTGKRYVVPYKALKLEWDASVFLILDEQWQLSEPVGFESIPNFRFRMADALAALRLAHQKAGDLTAFENEARAYREMAVKPQLSEDVRRLKVQAEAAIREKSFHDAADLYDEALALAPRESSAGQGVRVGAQDQPLGVQAVHV